MKDVTPEELTWRPGQDANHIAFLIWHIVRSEDGMFNRWIVGREQVWTKGGWDKKFGLKPDDSGGGWTSQQVAEFKPKTPDQILGYMAEVRKSVLEGLSTLDLKRLSDKPRPDRPEWTVATMLQMLAFHEAHHQGAIDYLKGLKRAPKS
jgi:uncharacterized damage-inducible protein DinB